MQSISPWWSLLPAAIGVWLFQRASRRRAKLSVGTSDPGVKSAAAVIRTEMRIDRRQDGPSESPASYYLVAAIGNDGELPATQLKGRCRVFSPVHKSRERIITVHRESLGNSPLELDGGRLDGFLIDADRPQDALFHVEIEFEYVGAPGEKPKSYSAKYAYNQRNGQLIQVL
jgi:hypothetical protein